MLMVSLIQAYITLLVSIVKFAFRNTCYSDSPRVFVRDKGRLFAKRQVGSKGASPKMVPDLSEGSLAPCAASGEKSRLINVQTAVQKSCPTMELMVLSTGTLEE